MKIQLSKEQYREDRENYIGYCIECGESHECVEPDAQNYTCEACGKDSVFGIEELLLNDQIDFIKEEN